MLSPEDKQQIEEEERYRAQLRTAMEHPAPQKAEPKTGYSFRKIAAVVLGITAVLLIFARMCDPARGGSPLSEAGAPARYAQKTLDIVSGAVVVTHGGVASYEVVVTPDMVNPVISGTFNATGVTGNDIEAVIADEDNLTNWMNGHQANVFWHTPGRETAGSFQVRVRPGTYYLGLSNRFSVFADKNVLVNASLRYMGIE